MPSVITIRPVTSDDYPQWRQLWDGYNAFYGRAGNTALPEAITQATWDRFHNQTEPVHALVAVEGTLVVGLVHYLFHRSTTRLNEVCYLQDLYTRPGLRGQGHGRALIGAVYGAADRAGAPGVYWLTQHFNTRARQLYDRIGVLTPFIAYDRPA